MWRLWNTGAMEAVTLPFGWNFCRPVLTLSWFMKKKYPASMIRVSMTCNTGLNLQTTNKTGSSNEGDLWAYLTGTFSSGFRESSVPREKGYQKPWDRHYRAWGVWSWWGEFLGDVVTTAESQLWTSVNSILRSQRFTWAREIWKVFKQGEASDQQPFYTKHSVLSQ